MADKVPAKNGSESQKNITNILLIAPHGHPDDDENTGSLVRLIAKQTGCYAIINEVYQKPEKADKDETADKQSLRVNLNRIPQVKEHLKNEFLAPLIKFKDDIVEQFESVLLIWIHGAENKSVRKDIVAGSEIDPSDVKILVGYGQGGNDKNLTAEISTIDALIEALNDNNLTAVKANSGRNKFCARGKYNMNQYFRLQKKEGLDTVQSIQLEFRMADCRDTNKNIKITANNLIQAISNLVQLNTNKDSDASSVESKALIKRIPTAENRDNIIEIEDPIVEKAYNKLGLVFSQNYEQALMEAGQYIVRTFYGGEEGIEGDTYDESFKYSPEVIKNTRGKESHSLLQLYAKISRNKDRNTPSRSWIYNAVNLVVLQHDMEDLLGKEHFQTFGNLLLSQKLFLLSVENDVRKKVIEDYHDQDKILTVKQFKQLLDTFQSKEDTGPLKLSDVLRKPEELEKEENVSRLTPDLLISEEKSTLKSLKKIAETKHSVAQSKIDNLKIELDKWERYSNNCDEAKNNIEEAILSKDKTSKKKSAKRKSKEPNIISVSRRTDIPAFYSDWFFNRIKEGSAIYRKDLTVKPKKVSLKPENVRCFVFWTKNPDPMLDRLDELKDYNYYFHFTLTPYGKNLEPHLPPKDKLVETFIRLSETVGKERVIWRYDPILLTDEVDAEYHKKHFAELTKSLHRHTDKCVISFISSLKNVSGENKDILKLKSIPKKVKLELARGFYDTASGYDLQIQACSQEIDYSGIGILRSTCVDGNFIGNLIGQKIVSKKDPAQRKHCQCVKSIDIGMDETCIHGCYFCYATHDHNQAKENHKRHNKNSPLLIGNPEDRDVLIWKIKNNEWTMSKNNVNFSTGCSNNCLYCYGRYMPYARNQEKKAKEAGQKWQWKDPIIREKDVKKKQSKRDGRVGFPTSHDITPENLDASLQVLGKLLEAGNDVMVISKPHRGCIKAICEKFEGNKDQILFRFTIGGKSEDILQFWEPNAPTYEHRLDCLKYAHAKGYQTSVSMEPLLEYDRVQEMVDEFMPHVTDAIWLGKMNHIPAFKDPDGRLKEELAKVEAGHSDDNIKALYEIYKDNPKIKWKLAYKDILEIPLPPAPGMDI